MIEKDTENKELVCFEQMLGQGYLDYAMSVIVSRAIPNAQDGLKPVQRRILYSMQENGFTFDKPYKKSARIIGDVLGKYHPHGNEALYATMVRMAQPFLMNIPLIDGQGNFGSIDGDGAAAYRYTEARLAKISKYLLQDYDKNTVDFVPNYDSSCTMPSVLPARFPNLLINGISGIAVGMATSIPPHNLSEVINATCALIDNPKLSIDELLKHILGPDLPVRCKIFKTRELLDLYKTGKGSFVMQAKIDVEGNSLVIREIPYQVTKSKIMEEIIDLSEDLTDVSDFRDESSQEEIRIVLDLKKGANIDIIKHKLFMKTQLQTRFYGNMLVLHNNIPRQLNLKETLQIFIEFREGVVIRRTKYFLQNAIQKSKILISLLLALSKLDLIVSVIRSSSNTQEARSKLQEITWSKEETCNYHLLKDIKEPYHFSNEQVQAILDLKLQALTSLEKQKLTTQLDELMLNINEYEKILEDRIYRFELIKREMLEVRDEFIFDRRSEISTDTHDNSEEDCIEPQDIIIAITDSGYIKRMPLYEYKAQRRGGIGRNSKPLDLMTIANTHQDILFFTTKGIAFSIRGYQIPNGSNNAAGRALVNVFAMEKEDRISSVLPMTDASEQTLIFITTKGNVRRNMTSDFENVRSNGKIAIKLDEDEKLLSVLLVESNDTDLLLTSSHSRTVRFAIDQIRIFNSRTSTGVIGIRMNDDEVVASASLIYDESYNVLTITKYGYGKRVSISDYRRSNRGTKGVITTKITEKTGKVFGAYLVQENDDVLIMTSAGKIFRMAVSEIRTASRVTQGVRLIKLNDNDEIQRISVIPPTNEE